MIYLYYTIIFLSMCLFGKCKGWCDNINYHQLYDARDSQGNVIPPTSFQFWSYYAFRFPEGHSPFGFIWDARHVFPILQVVCAIICVVATMSIPLPSYNIPLVIAIIARAHQVGFLTTWK